MRNKDVKYHLWRDKREKVKTQLRFTICRKWARGYSVYPVDMFKLILKREKGRICPSCSKWLLLKEEGYGML